MVKRYRGFCLEMILVFAYGARDRAHVATVHANDGWVEVSIDFEVMGEEQEKRESASVG